MEETAFARKTDCVTDPLDTNYNGPVLFTTQKVTVTNYGVEGALRPRLVD